MVRKKRSRTEEKPRVRAGIDDNVIRISEYDTVLLFTVLILVLFGVVMIFSSSYYSAMTSAKYKNNLFYFLNKQTIAVLLGIGAMFILAVLNYNQLPRLFAPVLYVIANICLIYVKYFGEEVNGATRWMTLPIIGFSFQPSELAKVSVILLLASYLAKDITRAKRFAGLIGAGVIILIPCALVFWGNNLSTALIIISIGGGMVFIASPYFLSIIALAGAGVTGLVIYLQNTSGFRGGRFDVWKNPWIDPTDKGYQPIQALLAVGSGGLFGLGLGQGRQKLIYMPEPHNDMIFAVICEELGFFGAGVVLALFGILLWRGVKIAMSAIDTFGTLVAIGAVIMIGVQVIINVAVVTNTIPNTGIPLPFISYGGTSISFILALMGIVLNISRYSKKV